MSLINDNIKNISIIVPTYNHEKYIGRCIRSLLNQSIDKNSYEIIVIDDCSTDQTKQALKVYENDINLILNKENYGLPKSLNIGIKQSKSKFIVRVDSDDYVNKDFLLMLSIFLQNNDDIDAVACDYFLIDEKENIVERKSTKIDPIACGIMFRYEQLIDIGLYDENFMLFEEREMRSRFDKKYSISYINLPLYRYRQHESNISKNKDSKAKYEKLLKEKIGI